MPNAPIHNTVIPAEAGIQLLAFEVELDPGLRRDDENEMASLGRGS
jgi:hypothetical protein